MRSRYLLRSADGRILEFPVTFSRDYRCVMHNSHAAMLISPLYGLLNTKSLAIGSGYLRKTSSLNGRKVNGKKYPGLASQSPSRLCWGLSNGRPIIHHLSSVFHGLTIPAYASSFSQKAALLSLPLINPAKSNGSSAVAHHGLGSTHPGR